MADAPKLKRARTTLTSEGRCDSVRDENEDPAEKRLKSEQMLKLAGEDGVVPADSLSEDNSESWPAMRKLQATGAYPL